MEQKTTLNERIAKYFLLRSRVTVLAFLGLIIFGLVSFFTLNITGFPNPQVNVLVINTIYPGASAKSVEDEVSRPIESAIKGIDGVESYNSSSQNNVSTVAITVSSGVNMDNFTSKVDSSLKNVELPSTAQTPLIIKPKISLDDFFFAITKKEGDLDYDEAYFIEQKLKTDIEKSTDIKAFTAVDEINQKLVIELDSDKLKAKNLTADDVVNSLRTWNFNIPVTQDARVNDKVQSLSLALSGESLEELKNVFVLPSSPNGIPSKLSDISTISIKALPKSEAVSSIGFREDEKTNVKSAVKFSLDIRDGVDLSKYEESTLNKIFEKYFDKNSSDYKNLSSTEKEIFSKYEIVEVYNSATANKEQADEVFAGLLGEKLPGLGEFGYVGFLLGGIELVFIVMLIIVSWRAALVAALAIPLSFFFSLIAVKLTGNDLNTLVLFSLVLVIGLVVDPALVLLESIQRQIDRGLIGLDAVLHAVKEIGNGLFLSVLTSILVFIPFGIVSGIFGQIISYIPLTVIPALIGSYVVPLIILSWLSLKVFKRNSKATDDEEENLWGVARWMTRYTNWVLQPRLRFVLLRIFIILVLLIVPIGIAGVYLGTGKVKQVQFAQPQDGPQLFLTINNYPQKLPESYSSLEKTVIETVMKNEDVKKVSNFGEADGRSLIYIIDLKETKERPDKKNATEIAADLQTKLIETVGSSVFDVNVNVAGAGPGTAGFPIALSVKTDDLTKEKEIALATTEILNNVCKKDANTFEIKSDCANDKKVIEKVDNGFSGTSSTFVQVMIQREKLALFPVNPITLRTQLSSLYKINDGNKVGTFRNNNEDLDIIISNAKSGPATLESIQATPISTLDGRTIKLSDIAKVSEVESLTAIRRVNGENVGVISAKVSDELNNQQSVTAIQTTVIDEFNKNYKDKFGSNTRLEVYSEGSSASITKSFSELLIALVLAIVLTYIVLVIFFNSFLQPLVILFAIPLTFIGIFPALSIFAGGQLGFLEIIGIIILVGIVENVAIFLIDAANQKINEGWEDRHAIAHATGIRFRPIILTKVTTLVSTIPLAVLSEFYRSLSVVIIFGLLTSGLLSLFTSPILFIFFRWVSKKFRESGMLMRLIILFVIFAPFIAIALAVILPQAGVSTSIASLVALVLVLALPFGLFSMYSYDLVKQKRSASL